MEIVKLLGFNVIVEWYSIELSPFFLNCAPSWNVSI